MCSARWPTSCTSGCARRPICPARFAILDQVLLNRADLDQQVSPDIAEAWRLLVRSGGQVRAGELASQVGWARGTCSGGC